VRTCPWHFAFLRIPVIARFPCFSCCVHFETCETALLYWHIGERINRDVLNHQRADYKIVSLLATQLRNEFDGTVFDERSLRRMMQFAHLFPDLQIVSPLATKLNWSHFTLPLKDGLQREFYLTMAGFEDWSKRTLILIQQ